MQAACWLFYLALLLSVVSTEGRRKSQCPREGLSKALTDAAGISDHKTCDWIFPTSNRLYPSNSSWWKPSKETEAVQHSSQAQALPPFVKAVVFFYFSPSCPYSQAIQPAMECLPKFFAPNILFFAVDISTFPSSMILNNGLVATPRVRLIKKDVVVNLGTASPDLEALVTFVENQSGQEAVGDMASIQECGSDPACSCVTKALPVTAKSIVELGNNRWMLLSCMFLVFAGVYVFKT